MDLERLRDELDASDTQLPLHWMEVFSMAVVAILSLAIIVGGLIMVIAGRD